MAFTYFTSNASTGAGSLVEAVKNAQPGDVIRPDESVFERGSTIEIVLASTLTLAKNLTFDGGPFRVRLVGGKNIPCGAVSPNIAANFTAFDFVGGRTGAGGGGFYVHAGAELTLNRCIIAGCAAGSSGGGVFVYGRNANGVPGRLVLNDSLVVGNNAPKGGGIAASGDVIATGATVCGNASTAGPDVAINATGSLTARNSIFGAAKIDSTSTSFVGSVVDVASSAIGFVVSPPDDFSVETWTTNAWQDWDLRLLDDASDFPSPYRDSGDVDAATQYDVQGNFRGREKNSATTCSPGAYETLQADLFWVGRDSTGAEVVAPSFLASDGWAASRFAETSGDVAPQAGQTLFIGRDVAFVDAPVFSDKMKLIAAAQISWSVGSERVESRWTLDVGVGATVGATSPTTYYASLVNRSRVGDYGAVELQLFSSSPTSPFRFVAPTAKLPFLALGSPVPSGPAYSQLTLFPSSSTEPRWSGDLNADIVWVSLNSDGKNLSVCTSPGAAIVCRRFYYGTSTQNESASMFTSKVEVRLTGVATAFDRGASVGTRYADDFAVDLSNATSATLTLGGQTVYGDASETAVSFSGPAKIIGVLPFKPLILNDATLILNDATLRTPQLTTNAGSRVEGRGRLEFPSNGRWSNEGATINGVAAEDYDAASNDVKIVYNFDASEIRNAFNDGVCRWTSEALDSGTLPFVFAKYSLDAQGVGDYRTIYNSSQPIVDASSPVYETVVDWDGAPLKTVVHATPETSWNFYRVEVPSFANLGGAKIYHGGKTTRYFVVWNADYEPEPTYYYCGGPTGSFATPSDWSLSADGIVKFESAPTPQNATFVVPSSTTLQDCPRDHLQISAVFPSIINVYDSNNRRLSDAEARLVSVGVPTPKAPEFYVGKGGTSGFWTPCDGATLYRVEALDGSATGLTAANSWLDANELKIKTWRARVAAPIHGGVEKWSTQTTAVQPFNALVEKLNYDDANAGNAFELVYSDDFDGVRNASITRSRKSDGTSTVLTQNFSGGEFTDVPETFDEYVYRVSWTPSPENVWLETTAAPWSVADGYDATTQINFITTPSRAYETPTFAARIAKKSNGELLKRQDVAKISYSLFETRDYGATRAERLAVGPNGSYWRHDVEIPAATVRDSLLVDPNFWSLDEIGANFVFSPEDGRPFFPRPGAYLVRATLETTNKRRIVVEFPTQVE